MVEIARRSGKYVVAESIETEDDLLRPSAAGCDRLKGYYFGKLEFAEKIAPTRMDFSRQPGEVSEHMAVNSA